MAVFAEDGYQAASLDEIAARAGITKAVLYDHFESKAALHLHVLRRERDRLLRHVKRRLAESGTDAPGVADALDAFYAWARGNPYAWRILFREISGDPELAAAHRRIQAKAHRTVVDLLLSGFERKLPGGRGDDETRAALAALVGCATHGMARWWYENPDVPRERMVELTMDVLWLGLERARRGEHWWSAERAG